MRQRLHILNSPLFLVALLTLALNDFLLKAIWPGFITGKLSDFAGVVVLVLFIRALSGRKWLALGITVVGFTWWKLSWSQGFIDSWNALELFAVSRVVDPGDLWALIVAPLALLYQPRQQVFRKRHVSVGLAALSFVLMVASNSDDIRFMHAMEGDNASELDGCKVTLERNGKSDMHYHFHQKSNGDFAVIEGKRDTVFRGPIVRYEDMYFVNRKHPIFPDDYYILQAFTMRNDSIQNFQSIFSKRPYALVNTDHIEKRRYFKDVNIIWSEANEQNIILINNEDETETYTAFQELLKHTAWHRVERGQ